MTSSLRSRGVKTAGSIASSPWASGPSQISEPSVEHCRLLVPEVAQQPPEPRRTAGHAFVVGDDERVRPDAGPTGSGRELLRRGQRMTTAYLGRNREVGELGVEIEERRAGNVALEVARAGGGRVAEVVPAVREASLHAGSMSA